MAKARTLLASLSLVAIIAIVGWWYLAVYDTAEGRCARGDLGACIVFQTQEQQRQVEDILRDVGNSI